mmetsp:Transcript_4154/g.12714  ORF Transcript_4154/g.12714 Transcript_4154/m.12714 type:complete len:209 (+) Transcript_4154:38-664(+)
MSSEKLGKGGGSAPQHVIVSRRSVFTAAVMALGVLSGSLMAERFRLRHNSGKLRSSKGTMKATNSRLKAEKDEYKNLFKLMSDRLEQWKSARDMSSAEHKSQLESFKDASKVLMMGLDDVRSVLEEKEFQLWEKEGLLEYQEERLMNTEDLEHEMTAYINTMAATLLDRNHSLPDGLVDQPYFGHADDPSPAHLRGLSRSLHKDGWSP